MIQVEGFNVRIVTPGEPYGTDDSIIHGDNTALVEFYDAKADAATFGRRGQFVTRYYCDELEASEFPQGLLLDGGHPAWSISPLGMRDVQRYLRGYLQEAA